MTRLNLAFSPCPNDTFMFHAMLHGLVETAGLDFVPRLLDIDTLNEEAFAGASEITKLSCFAYLKLKDSYTLLESGAALGFGCGPLVVTTKAGGLTPDDVIAIPGELTTANLLLKLWDHDRHPTVVTRYDAILDGVAAGRYGAGLIIHEGRFVYQDHGCRKLVDLGQWWEELTGLPIPLGCIAVRNDSPALAHKIQVEAILKDSIHYAFNLPERSRDYIKQHAREMEDAVITEHIKLYVNEFSLNMGATGKRAINRLEEMAKWANVL